MFFFEKKAKISRAIRLRGELQRRTKDIFKKNIASYSKQPSVPDLMLSAVFFYVREHR